MSNFTKYITTIVWEAPSNLTESEVGDLVVEELNKPFTTSLACYSLETQKTNQ